MAPNSDAEMEEETGRVTLQHQEQEHHNVSDLHPLSAHSSPPQPLRSREDPSPPARSPSSSTDFSDHTCYSHEHSSIEDAISIEPHGNFVLNPPSPMPVAANRAQPTEAIVVTKVDDEIQGVRKVEEGSDADVERGDGGAVGRSRELMANSSFKNIKRENMRKKALLGFRICAFSFCMASFSVMAADKNQGWALDSFYRYKELRYCMTVNIIGFVYSAFQSYDLVYYLASGKHMIRNRFKPHFDLFIDQVLAYLLLSASSSAATRVDDWQSNWGKDKFTDMAAASVGLSSVAFAAFASSCLISGYILCKSA